LNENSEQNGEGTCRLGFLSATRFRILRDFCAFLVRLIVKRMKMEKCKNKSIYVVRDVTLTDNFTFYFWQIKTRKNETENPNGKEIES
jgi:hypothetical protein